MAEAVAEEDLSQRLLEAMERRESGHDDEVEPEGNESDLGEPAAEEVEEEEEEEKVRRRKSSGKARKSASKSKARSRGSTTAAVTDKEEMANAAGRHLRTALGFALVAILVFDLFTMGLRAGSTPFVDWWDMIGTAAYLRGRHEQFALRKKANQRSLAWAGYVVLDAFILYEIAGKTARTVMRKTPVLPTLMGLSDFIVYGFLPVQFFPGDYLYELADKNDVHVLIISAFWGLTKVRSLSGQIREAVFVHHYGFPAAFMLCMLSCEIASVYSRIEMNLTRFPLKECMRRFPGGMLKWTTSRTFMSSIFISIFMYATVKVSHIPVVWVVPNLLALMACFYRYANGLLERTVGPYLKLDKSVREYDAQLKSLVERLDAAELQDSLKAVPDKVVHESIKLTESLILSLDKLGEDSKYDLEELMRRLQELSAQLEHQAAGSSEPSKPAKSKKVDSVGCHAAADDGCRACKGESVQAQPGRARPGGRFCQGRTCINLPLQG